MAKQKKSRAKVVEFSGFTLDIDHGGNLSVRGSQVDLARSGDYGADPIGDGTFRMVPSGDIVSFAERCRRLGTRLSPR